VSSGEQAAVREWHGQAINADFVPSLGAGCVASAPFRTEHLAGRVFFSGLVRATGDVLPIVALVAREVGNSLDQLYLADRMQRLAAREERIRLARDLHDGVLQSLTGIRLAIQTMASDVQEQAAAKDRLLAIERAIAIEQRELRLFISDIRPEAPSAGDASSLVEQLEEMCGRLRLEWKAPIKIRVSPALTLPAANERVLRLMIHEAIVNALKHGHPSRVTVDVHERGEGALKEMVVAVSDDGRGFSFRGRVEHDTLIGSRIGPASLLDRVVGLGGRMSIESNPSGARVEFVLPAAAERG
jgi:signal transduction histidine kinase